MTLKKYLISLKGQTAVEYIMVFIVITLGIIIIFKSLSPENNKTKDVFNQVVNKAISEINQW